MALDTSGSDRLLSFCSKLPAIPGGSASAAVEARFTLACLAARCTEIEAAMLTSASNSHSLALLRCEFEAIDSAKRVVNAIWLRRFDSALANP